jgi:2-amino-4-hydroxy-6-hydroxymethyldihydropteridine diphosphokinase
MALAMIALGTNVGDGIHNLRVAVRHLDEIATVQAVSRIYRTTPMYVADQPEFHNAAVAVRTDLGPLPLLRVLKGLEDRIGRLQRERYGPREIDLDLISYGCLRYRFTHQGQVVLEVPHPRTPERRFVLAPLADFASSFELPGLGLIADLLRATETQSSCVLALDASVSL